MDNRSSKRKKTEVQIGKRTERRNDSTGSSRNSSGAQTKILHARRSGSKEEKNKGISKTEHRRGVEEEESRLAGLEEALVAATTHPDTPFNHISAISNPGLSEITSFPAVQYWFESYRTVEREAVAQVLRLTQEVLFGSNIISSMSTESAARLECYSLQEEVERRIVGLMPLIVNEVEVIFPIYDVDSAFSQIEESGVFTLTTMYVLKWIVSKGAKNG